MESTARFSSRVEHYLRFRPRYPKEIVQLLSERTGLTSSHSVADIGSGTGFSAKIFLGNGNIVYGVEPNRDMREAGEDYLHRFENFHSVNGTAEHTTLPDGSVDYVVCGQAFHWFDRTLAKTEFRRILRPGGWVVLMWNDREFDTTPFLRDYESLLEDYGTDYSEVNHRNINESILGGFFEGEMLSFTLPNVQMLDLKGVRGRLLSSSYIPVAGDPNYQPMLNRLTQIFSRHAKDGKIEMRYTLRVFAGHV